MTLDHVSRKMWLEMMVLLRSLQTRFPLGAINVYCNTFYLLASLHMPGTLAVLTHSKTLSN